MKERELAIIPAIPEESEDDANRLYEAGCADGCIRGVCTEYLVLIGQRHFASRYKHEAQASE